MKYSIYVVGAGGTGGNFLKEFGRFLKFFYEEGTSWSLGIIDGDTVEERNAERQPFMACDAMQHKASIMAEGLVECIELPQARVHAYPQYLDTEEQFKSIIGSDGMYGDDVLIIVGCVDNHRARQVLHQTFHNRKNCIYLDAANEFSEGEVCVGIRLAGKEVAPPRAYFFPEVLTDTGKRASELSCGVVNVSAPQHLITNLAAAQHLLSFMINIMKNHNAEGGVLHFNAFTHFVRFDKWTPEMQAEKEAREEKAKEVKEHAKPKLRTGKKATRTGK